MEPEEEYEMEEVRYHLASFRGSRLALFASDLRLGRFRPHRRSRRRRALGGEVGAAEAFFRDLVIHPDNKWYRLWTKFILVWAVYNSFFTPLEFGFFRGLPRNLFFLDIAGQIAFLIDIIVKFFVHTMTQTRIESSTIPLLLIGSGCSPQQIYQMASIS